MRWQRPVEKTIKAAEVMKKGTSSTNEIPRS